MFTFIFLQTSDTERWRRVQMCDAAASSFIYSTDTFFPLFFKWGAETDFKQETALTWRQYSNRLTYMKLWQPKAFSHQVALRNVSIRTTNKWVKVKSVVKNGCRALSYCIYKTVVAWCHHSQGWFWQHQLIVEEIKWQYQHGGKQAQQLVNITPANVRCASWKKDVQES